MGKYRVTTEDGKTYEIETEDEIRIPAGAKSTTAGAGQTPQQPGQMDRFREEAWKRIDPAAMGEQVLAATTQPLDTLKGIGQAQGTLLQQSIDAFNQGKYTRALRKGIHGMIPLLGPDMDAAADMFEQGDYGGGAGAVAGTLAGMVTPEAIRNVRSVPAVPRIRNYNPVEQRAIDYAVSEGVPLSSGTTTGNRFIRNTEYAGAQTPVGSVVAYGQNRKVEPALQRVAAGLADRALPGQSMTPELAGHTVKGNLESTVEGYRTRATAQYDPVWQTAEHPSSLRNVQTGWKDVPDPSGAVDPATGKPLMTRQPVMEDVATPVDVRQIKALVKPLEARLSAAWEPAKQYSSAGLHAMRSILNGPDYIPARTAEINLGGLKRLSREDAAGIAGGDVARQIIPDLQQRIDSGVSAVDPGLTPKLQRGRELTRIGHEVQDVLDDLRGEDVQAYGQTVQKQDSGIGRLRNIEAEAPGSGRMIGRAWLEDLIDRATKTGGFRKSQGLLEDWNKLGPRTKEILFPNPLLRQNIGDFLLAAQKYNESPNPSGSGGIVATLGALTGGGGWAFPWATVGLNLAAGGITKLLYSPKTAKLLNRGFRIPAGNPAANAAWVTELMKEAGQETNREKVRPAEAMPDYPYKR